MPELHPLCEPLAILLGTWQGAGVGHYPTIEDFFYVEELTFGHVGKPFVSMTQRSRNRVTDEPLHSETGYVRALGDGAAELSVAQPSGIVEVHAGSMASSDEGLVLTFDSTQVALTPSAKSVTAVRRRLTVTGSSMVSELWMAAVGHADLVHHLRGELTRL